METLTCKKCGEVKEAIVENFKREKRNKSGFSGTCRTCSIVYVKEYEARYKKEKPDQWAAMNSRKRLKYYEKNKERLQAESRARMSTPEQKARTRERLRRKRAEDPAYAISNNVSRAIRRSMQVRNPRGSRTFHHLPYTPQQLKEHLEQYFDEHMTWDNYGTYWHIDHVYPQSKLPYDSYEHPNFIKCWSLDNLRPLEARANIIKGNKV